MPFGMSHAPCSRLQMPFLSPSARQESTVMLMYACYVTGVAKAAQSEEQRAHEECHPPSLLLDHCLS